MVKIADGLYFQPEYAYSQMGGQVKNSDSTYSFNYFSLPLLLKCQVHEKFSIMAGPQFDLLINTKKTIKGNFLGITHDTEERSLAAIAGVEYQVTSTFSICARYMYGLNHVGIGKRCDVQEFKYETVQLLACIRF